VICAKQTQKQLIAITTNPVCVASPAGNLNDDGGDDDDDDDEDSITCMAHTYNIYNILCSSRPITTLFCNCFLYTVAPSVWF